MQERETSRNQCSNSFCCKLSFPWIYLLSYDTPLENRGQQCIDCYSKQILHNITIYQSQACSTLCQIVLCTILWRHNATAGLTTPAHTAFGQMSLSTLGSILYLTGCCNALHPCLILKLSKLWSIHVCWHLVYTVVLCVNVLSLHRLSLI